MGELRSLAMISGGMVLGSMGGKAIDKMLKVDETTPGFQVKKLVRPMALLGAGVLGSMKLKNQDLKMVSAGVGAAGVVSTVKVVLKKDLLAGLDGGVAGLGEAMSVYRVKSIIFALLSQAIGRNALRGRLGCLAG